MIVGFVRQRPGWQKPGAHLLTREAARIMREALKRQNKGQHPDDP